MYIIIMTQVEFEEEHSLLIDSTVIPLPFPELPSKVWYSGCGYWLVICRTPTQVQDSIAGILAAESASRQDQIAAWEEPIIVTKYELHVCVMNS